MAAKGQAKSGGRKRGTPNRLGREVREFIREALDREGGAEYLQRAAREQPVAFLGLLGKLLPAEIRASLDHEGLPTVILRDYTGLEHEKLPAEPEEARTITVIPLEPHEPPPARVTVEL